MQCSPVQGATLQGCCEEVGGNGKGRGRQMGSTPTLCLIQATWLVCPSTSYGYALRIKEEEENSIKQFFLNTVIPARFLSLRERERAAVLKKTEQLVIGISMAFNFKAVQVASH